MLSVTLSSLPEKEKDQGGCESLFTEISLYGVTLPSLQCTWQGGERTGSPLSSPEEPLTTWPMAWEEHTQPTLLPFHKQAQEWWWNRAAPYSSWYFLERKNVTGSKAAFQEQQQRKNTQPSLGQLGQAVNGINTSQDATEPKSIGNPFYGLPCIQEKHKIQFPSHLAKNG